VVFRYLATPLTTFVVGVEREEDRFPTAFLRDANSLRIEPGVEFKPFALVSGRAVVGYRKHTSNAPGYQEFTGPVASADLQYALRGHTRFNVNLRRDLEYSYLYWDMVVGGATVSVTHRLGDAWDVGANVGRYRSNYREAGRLRPAVVETTVGAGASLGYNVGDKMRVSTELNFSTRTSEVSQSRKYDRVRAVSSLSYTF
jgi:hypothetical protein